MKGLLQHFRVNLIDGADRVALHPVNRRWRRQPYFDIADECRLEMPPHDVGARLKRTNICVATDRHVQLPTLVDRQWKGAR